MGAHRGILVPRKILAVLLAWAVTMLDALVPAYVVGGLGELRDAGERSSRTPPEELGEGREAVDSERW
jgi:hypothetical protein